MHSRTSPDPEPPPAAPPIEPPLVEPPPIHPPTIAPPPIVAAAVEPLPEPPPVELLSLTCPSCSNVFQVATTLLGCRVACPTCQALVMAAPAALQSQSELPLPATIEPASPPTAPPQSTPTQPRTELTPKDRARRRLTRNLILWVICLAILIAVVWLMTR